MTNPGKASDVEPRICNSSDDVLELLRDQLIGLEQEQFWVIGLDIRNRVRSIEVVAKGTVHTVAVYPRDVFRSAIRTNVAGIVLAHNHPSEDPTPSLDDIALTRRLVAAGRLLGVPVVDHVVLTEKHGCVAISDYHPSAVTGGDE